MKVHVDSTKCSAYGACVETCPSVFEFDEWGYAKIIGDGTVLPEHAADVRDAEADCPEQAISVEE